MADQMNKANGRQSLKTMRNKAGKGTEKLRRSIKNKVRKIGKHVTANPKDKKAKQHLDGWNSAYVHQGEIRW